MVKRVFLFIITNILVMLTISIAWSLVSNFLGLNQAMGYMPFLLIFSVFWGMAGAFISLWMSKFMAKWMMGVQIIDPKTNDPGLRSLVEKVHDLARRAKLPKMPEVGIYNSPEVNAFATGPSKSNSLVAVSTGLLNRMSKNDVDGVLGHEIAHISNGDMVTMTLIQGIINAFVIFFSRIIATLIGSQVEEKNRPIIEFVAVIVLQILFGILGALVVNYFSRQREFRADLGGAQFSGKANMIGALQSLKGTLEQLEPNQSGYASLKISGKDGGFSALFSTHPSLDERIERLQKANIF